MAQDDAQKPNATEQAYRSIRSDIISGALAEGERLTEARLSQDLRLSRTPIREAIGRLVLEGLVERHGGYTTRVAEFPDDDIEQVYELRRLIECYAVRRAAIHASDEDTAELRRIHGAMTADTPPADEPAYRRLIDANEAFHQRIALAAQSPRLMTVMSTVFNMGMVVRTYRTFTHEDLQRSLRHHAELITAIEARAPDWAEAVMSAHLLAGAARAARHVRAAANGSGQGGLG